MCGFVSIFPTVPGSFQFEDLSAALSCMVSRGPDGEGLWQEDDALLGHRRLAILDLDQRSHQPMVSTSGRLTIAFNGEIYNFRELRATLQARGVSFRTTSDTEVLLCLFEAHGEAMLPMLRGMFAFVIWDRVAKRGFAARDPYGIKPLYYAQTAHGLLMASQVKALLATGRVSRESDARAQASFWLLGSVPEPLTWFRDIRALQAGHSFWIEGGRAGSPSRWWDISASWRDAPSEHLPAAEVRERVSSAVRRSVAAHLVSDVPVGVFLSGGIDSGTLAGLMVDAGARNLQGVTLAFQEFAGRPEDEASVAAKIAAHYGIRHHVRVVSRSEFHADLPRILRAMDQPSIDGVNTWYASKAVAELGLKVVVSGVGGDELFQGYPSFDELPRLVSTWRKLSRLPGAMALAGAFAGFQSRRTNNHRWRHVADWSRSIGGAWWLRRGLFSPEDLPALMGDDLADEALRQFDAEAWVGEMSGHLPEDLRLALGQIESTTYLRNQLLRDSDWASMDHSVELRTPLVDAWLLRDLEPLLSSLVDFPGKALLAGSAAKVLPREVLQRQKTGFGIPMGRWLSDEGTVQSNSTSSRDWARQLVSAYASQV